MLGIVLGRRKLNIILICIVTFIMLFSIGSMIFIKNIYDGSFPRVDKSKFSGHLRYSDVHGYERKTVKFDSGNNTLTGYIYGEENKKGMVVIAHGLGLGAEDYMAETLNFVDKGWRVFSYDCTGTYESEGKNTVGLPQSVIDLNAVMTYIKSNNTLNNLPIMLYGHSWGAYAVTAILNYNYDIHAVVSISGFNSPMELMNEVLKGEIGALSYVEYPFGWACQTMLFGSTSRVTAVNGINRTDTPIMIIHGDKDKEISYNGASIIAHKGEITNPNVIYKTRSVKNQNGHNDLYKSGAAIEYIKEKNIEYKKLYDRYNGKIPDDIKAKYYEGVDKFKACELDVDFIDEINSFFEKQL